MARTSAGFSLIETLVASTIVISGLSAVALIFSYSITTNFENRIRTTAMFLLSDRMEELRPRRNIEPGDYVETVAVEGISYRIRWRVSNTPRLVTVVVYAAHPGSSGNDFEMARGAFLFRDRE